MARTDAPIVYFNIGWMESYAGTVGDKISGGHGFLADHDFGGEAFNFDPYADGMVRGCRPGSIKNLNITRLGAARGAQFIDGVLVVWMAREPKSKKALIVGWYQNARIHRAAFEPSNARAMPNGELIPITAEARAKDSVLLPIEARNFQIASSRVTKHGFGQSPTWYGAEPVDRLVRRYIDGATKRLSKPRTKQPPRQQDHELRKLVEQAAVNHAVAYFKSPAGGRCRVVSVEAEAKGWDLEATSAEAVWLVEVKGLSGKQLICEVTPNEYRAMGLSSSRKRYVLYVVCNALTSPIASIFRWEDGAWRTEDGRELDVRERVAAVLSCS